MKSLRSQKTALVNNFANNKAMYAELGLLSFAIMVIFALVGHLTPSWLTWSLCLPAWVIIVITAATRVKDITALGKRWCARRLGLILVFATTISMAAAPIWGYTNALPSWRGVLFAWGFALTWLTTPNMPPWNKYISGEYKMKKGQQA